MANPQPQPTTGQPPVTTPTPAPATAPVAQAPQGNQPTQGQAPNGSVNAPSPNQPHLNLYDKILRATAPPPVRYVDAQGNQQTVPQTRGSLGRSVLASVLAGMMVKPQYREGAFGPVYDSQATNANAFKAGQDQQTQQQKDAQDLSDKMQANKLMAVKNNVDTTHAYAALAQQKHQDLQAVIDSNSDFVKDLDAYDAQQSDPANKLILAKGLTYQQALASPQWGQGSLTKNNLVMSGQQKTYDPETGKTNIEPLYTIINPNGKIKMSADAVAKLSTINPQFQAAFDGANGDLRFPVHQYLAAMNQLNTVQHIESFAKRADEALGVSDKCDLAAAVRKNSNLMPAINAAENALAQGGSTADVLQRVQQSPNSSVIFDAMGISQDDVTKYIQKTRNEETRQQELAKKGADTEAKGIANENEANQILSNPKSTPELRTQATTFLRLTAQQKANDEKARIAAENAGKTAQDQPQIESAAKSLAAGDLTALSDITSMRSDMRTKVYARAKELNPNFNTGDIKIKMGTQDEFTKGKAGDQIQSFNTFLGHAGEAATASAAYRRASSPLLNKPLNWIEKNAANDSDYQTFITALQPVRDEYMTFLQNNHALTESDKKAGETIVSNESTPAQIEGALKQMSKTAFIRLDSLNARYKRVMHTDFPDLLSDDAKESANILGLGNYAQKYQTGGSVTGGAGGPVAGKTNSQAPQRHGSFNPNALPDVK